MSYQDDFASTATIITSPTVTTSSVKILSANSKRIGLLAYNNSSNSIYICFGKSGNAGTVMTAIIGAFANWTMPHPIYTGEIWAIRNAGTGTVAFTELTD